MGRRAGLRNNSRGDTLRRRNCPLRPSGCRPMPSLTPPATAVHYEGRVGQGCLRAPGPFGDGGHGPEGLWRQLRALRGSATALGTSTVETSNSETSSVSSVHFGRGSVIMGASPKGDASRCATKASYAGARRESQSTRKIRWPLAASDRPVS